MMGERGRGGGRHRDVEKDLRMGQREGREKGTLQNNHACTRVNMYMYNVYCMYTCTVYALP